MTYRQLLHELQDLDSDLLDLPVTCGVMSRRTVEFQTMEVKGFGTKYDVLINPAYEIPGYIDTSLPMLLIED